MKSPGRCGRPCLARFFFRPFGLSWRLFLPGVCFASTPREGLRPSRCAERHRPIAGFCKFLTIAMANRAENTKSMLSSGSLKSRDWFQFPALFYLSRTSLFHTHFKSFPKAGKRRGRPRLSGASGRAGANMWAPGFLALRPAFCHPAASDPINAFAGKGYTHGAGGSDRSLIGCLLALTFTRRIQGLESADAD